jgi:hypothetical protein
MKAELSYLPLSHAWAFYPLYGCTSPATTDYKVLAYRGLVLSSSQEVFLLMATSAGTCNKRFNRSTLDSVEVLSCLF